MAIMATLSYQRAGLHTITISYAVASLLLPLVGMLGGLAFRSIASSWNAMIEERIREVVIQQNDQEKPSAS